MSPSEFDTGIHRVSIIVVIKYVFTVTSNLNKEKIIEKPIVETFETEYNVIAFEGISCLAPGLIVSRSLNPVVELLNLFSLLVYRRFPWTGKIL
jgi:hypothetical protein